MHHFQSDGMPDYVWDVYDTTPVMSSYLVAMMVSEYKIAVSDPPLNDFQVRILAPNEVIGKTKYNAGFNSNDFSNQLA